VVWLFLAPILAVLLAALLGAPPTAARAGRDGLLAMGVACALSVVAIVLGSAPVAWAAIRSPKHVHTFGYGASLVRALILAALATPTALMPGLNLRPFLLWIGISYVVALGAEVVFLVLVIQSTEFPGSKGICRKPS